MSSSDEIPFPRVNVSHRALQVEAADSETEISVVDSAFRVVARGLGRLEAALPVGLYKVRARTGGHEVERLVSIDPGPVMHASSRGARRTARPSAWRKSNPSTGPMAFPLAALVSPAPLEGTLAPDPHVRGAERESRVVHAKKGEGSRIFVCVRDEPRPGRLIPSPSPDMNTAAGLVLHDLHGALIADFEHVGVQGGLPGSRWAACTVEVDPGAYLLSLKTQDAPLRQAIIASPGWQTQVFVLLTSETDDAASRRADLADAAFLLSRSGFDPAKPQARQAELARLRLRDRHSPEMTPEVTPERLASWFSSDIEDPMLLVLRLHLALRLGPLDDATRQVMQEVVARLRGLVGEHPDVEALATRIEPARTPPPRFEVPPMLLASWALLSEEAKSRPELIPIHSLLARIATQLWGEGPALVWREPAAAAGLPVHGLPTLALAAFATEVTVDPSAAEGRTVDEWVDQLRTLDLEAARARPDLDVYERVALEQIAPSRPPRVSRGPAAPAETMEQRLVRALDVPRSVVLRVLAGLHWKLTH